MVYLSLLLFTLDQFVICEPLCRVPKTLTRILLQRVHRLATNPQRRPSPQLPPNAEETTQEPLKPGQMVHQTPLVLGVLQLCLPEPLQVSTLQVPPLAQNRLSPPGHPQ
jgi:hypothetical protein